MYKLIALLLLLSVVSACGRSSTDIYRAYGSSSSFQTDLASRNRRSFQEGIPSAYLYIQPQQTDTGLLPADTSSETREQDTDTFLPGELVKSAAQPQSKSTPSPVLVVPSPVVKKDKPRLTQPLAVPVYRQAPAFELEDLQGKKRAFTYPLAKPTVMAFADQKGAEQMEAWITPLYARYGDRIEIHGVAELSAVPGFARGIARGIIGGLVKQPIMLDWTGKVSKQFGMQPKVTNIYVLDTQGQILAEGSGLADLDKLTAFVDVLDPLLKP